MLLLRRRAAAALLLVFVAAAAAAASPLPVEPMEHYFSPAELSRMAGYGEEPVSSVSVCGQVACELCLRPTGSGLLSFELPGAKVAVLCETDGPNDQAANSAFAATDEFGNFTIELPSQLHATANLERACTVRVLQLPADSACRLRHQPGTAYGLTLTSQEDGIRAYTTGVIRLQNSDTPRDKCVSVEERTRRR